MDKQSSVDKVIAGDTSTANWCNVLGVLDAAADYLGAYDREAYDLICAHIESFPLKLQWRTEANAIDQLARIEQYLIADGIQCSRAYGHGNVAAGPEILALWDAYQIVHGIRTAWIESIE